jgi:hypothetical protein
MDHILNTQGLFNLIATLLSFNCINFFIDKAKCKVCFGSIRAVGNNNVNSVNNRETIVISPILTYSIRMQH